MNESHKDKLSWLLEAGMPLEEIHRLQQDGLSTDEITTAAERLITEGKPLNQDSSTGGRKARPASSFGKNNTRFLWYPYHPVGDYSVLMAEGGTGKTILCCGIAVAVSTGNPLPGEVFTEEGKTVLVVSAEDSGEILKERLEPSEANLENVYILDCNASIGMNFSDGYEEFEATVRS